jgi:hypothetical protein
MPIISVRDLVKDFRSPRRQPVIFWPRIHNWSIRLVEETFLDRV